MRRIGTTLGAMVLVVAAAVTVAVAQKDLHPADGDLSSAARGKPMSPQARARSGESIIPVRDIGEPCDDAGAAVADLGDLATKIPIWEPEGEHLTRAFLCGPTPILFYKDVEVTYEDGYSRMIPEKTFADMVAQDGGRVAEINGRPAYVRAADSKGPRNAVWILAGDYSIGLAAKPEVGIERVIDVAREIHVPASVD